MLPSISHDIPLGNGKILTIETGHIARQADGAVMLRIGKTMLFASVVAQTEPREGADFLPLSVDYQEKFASNGRIPGGFIKKETRLNDYEILVSRLVDRVIRPMFPDNYYCDTQVAINLVSFDEADISPDSLAALAASAALYISDIPFNNPISEVRIIRKNGDFMVNPNYEEAKDADINLMIGASQENILMVEGEMQEVQEEEMIEAIKQGHEAIKLQCEELQKFREKINRPIKKEYKLIEDNFDLKQEIHDLLYDKIKTVASASVADKDERKLAFKQVIDPVLERFEDRENIDKLLLKKYIKITEKEAIREVIFDSKKRLDGRKSDQIRAIDIEINYLPSAHGSALFTRGDTQSLSTVTLGSKDDEQMVDRATMKSTNNFYLHYNFPGFATGEVKPNRGSSRREIGHGNLAYRALKNILSSEESYTVRIVSDILESNGSSSMATVCAGSLALMDSGFKIREGVSGIAMGLVSDEQTGRYAILSDILGDEDHLGDMDFKVTGTRKGITACQMDIKIKGLAYNILHESLEQAKKGRLYILDKMNAVIDAPRKELKSHVPRVKKLIIPKSLIGAVIGPGGKIIQNIQEESQSSISIVEEDDKGHVYVHASSKENMDKALDMLNDIVAVPEVGEIYDGIVKKVTDFGAFVEFFKGKEGLLHVSEIANFRVNRVEDFINFGDNIQVKLVNIQDGKYRLTCKDVMTFENTDDNFSENRKPKGPSSYDNSRDGYRKRIPSNRHRNDRNRR